MKSSLSLIACFTLHVAVAYPWRVAAESEPDFKGKTIRIVIGTSTGGGVYLYARLVTATRKC